MQYIVKSIAIILVSVVSDRVTSGILSVRANENDLADDSFFSIGKLELEFPW